MRVLYWTESFFPKIGGSEVAAGVLLDGMRSRGHEFAVMTRQWSPDEPERDEWHGIPVHRVAYDDGTFARRDPREFLPLRQRVLAIKRGFGPDLIHIGLTGPTLFLHLFTAKQAPAPTLMTLHVEPVDAEYGDNQPVRQALRTADWIAPVSHALARAVLDRMPELAGRCEVIHNALPEPTAELSPVSFEPPRLLCVGRVDHLKGFDVAIGAMPRVVEAFPDAELVIAGDGEAADRFRDLARRLGVSRAVRILGWKPPHEVPGLIDGATLVLSPSRKEPFGLVALQTAQRGRVSLAADVDGLPEVVQHERTGLLLPPDEPDQWGQAICELLRDRDRITRMGAAAKQSAIVRFNLTRYLDQYESLYQQLADGNFRQKASA